MTLIRSRYFRDGQRVAAVVEVLYRWPTGAVLTVPEGSLGTVIARHRESATYSVKWDGLRQVLPFEVVATNLVGAPTVVLLFSNVARAELAARLHAPSCSMLNVSKGRQGAVSRIDDPTADDLADLNGRGFQVKRCRCLPAERA